MMNIRSYNFGLLLRFSAAILGAHTVFTVSGYCADNKDLATSTPLLKEASKLIIEKSDEFIVKHKTDALLSKLSILESESDVKSALERARSITSPFYSSLALCGIAATELPSDPATSVKRFREALARSRDVKHWTGSHATSLGCLFELLPVYPEKEAHDLLKASKEAFDAWAGSDYQRSQALLALSKATTAIAPEAATNLLYNVALKSNHYWDSIEYLATFMAQQSMEEALELSEKHYTAKRDWPNDQYFRRAVLIEFSKTDFPKAFAGIKRMRKLDQEIAAVKLAESLLAEDREKDARVVIAHIESLESDFNWTQSSLKNLRSKLEQGEQVATPSVSVTPKTIDDFLNNPSTAQLQTLSNAKRMVFRDEQQVRTFISTSFPLVEGIRDMGYPHHGSPRSATLGLLVVCSSLAHDIPQALDISKRIAVPELRVSYLLDAYEATHPVGSTVSKWPIHFWGRKTVLIQEGKEGPNQAMDSDKK